MRGIDARNVASGFIVFRASRMDALLEPLMQMLAATQPDSVLAAQTIIAAHPGLRQWLSGALARRHGSRGIVANLDVVLPSAWIDRQALEQLGRRAVSLPNYGQSRLRWTIHAILSDAPARYGIAAARLGAFLRGDEASLERRRFQLADRLARIYSQYLVYRPDWLAKWERSRFVTNKHGADAIEPDLLAPLWREIRRRRGPHRGEVVEELIGTFGIDALLADRAAVHVFGVGHLAPSELRVLKAAASTRVVALYVPDPCREYWGGISADRNVLSAESRAEAERIERCGGEDFWVERDHPLLARWGRLGQHFMLALADAGADEDMRHWQDEAAIEPASRLERVQQSIRAGVSDMLAADLRDPRVREREPADSSLRIHSCHTRLRELEVLRDNLIDAIEAAQRAGNPLKPSEIVVMAPDIESYVPLIAAVFGAAGTANAALPYHLADVAVSNTHRLLGAFRRLLDLPTARVTAPEIADLLAVPEIARRLDIDADGVEQLVAWLRRSRVAWALDGAHRERLGLPPIDEYTFGWAMDRMLAGYLMAADDGGEDEIDLPDGCQLAPLPGIEAPAAACLGALDQLLRDIEAFCALTRRARRASEWSDELERVYGALVRINAADRGAREAHAAVLRFIREIAAEPAEADVDPTLQYAVVRDLLLERLAAVPERQRFLMGGITFCGMVPRRAIPFRMIAVLGLNDGEFPRADSDAGLDLMARHRRLGDRDVRSDDRYLFLETVMAARDRLHLSYVGQGVRDGKPRNPAIPLAELLDALGSDPAPAPAKDAESTEAEIAPRGPPWLVRHPLQPFDARYFDASARHDPRLFSYHAAYARMHGTERAERLTPFYDGNVTGTGVADVERSVAVAELRGYFKDPSRHVLLNHMKVRLDALADDRLREDEPLDAKLEAIERVAQRLFFDEALKSRSWPCEKPPAWLRLSGLLPPGAPGRIAWENERDKASRLLDALRSIASLPSPIPELREEVLDVQLAGWRVTGSVAHVLATSGAATERTDRRDHAADADDRQVWHIVVAAGFKSGELKPEADLTFKDRVPAFLDWALLRLRTARAAMPPGVRLALLTAAKERPWQDAINAWDGHFVGQREPARAALLDSLEKRVVRLLEIWHAAQDRPFVYFPRVSWQVVAHDDASAAAEAASRAWFGANETTGERDYEPGYNALLAGEWTFAPDSAETSELMRFARELRALTVLDMPLEQAS